MQFQLEVIFFFVYQKSVESVQVESEKFQIDDVCVG
eukprot:GSA120T00003796001.1